MRLIDADDVLRSMKQFRDVREKDMEMTGSRGTGCSWDDAVTIIKRTPTVEPNMAQVLAYECGKDSVSVVRCKDCKHYNAGFECLIEGYGIDRPKDWFCADGERKEDITPLKTSGKSGISFQ